MKYVALFIAIQLAALLLTIVGIPVCAALAYIGYSFPTEGKWHWPKWAWIWDNEEDGVWPNWYAKANPTWSTARVEFMWTGLRNSANNLRYVPGVSKVGRPLWRKTWGAKPGGWYAQAGWNNSGFPVLSAGRNVNPY